MPIIQITVNEKRAVCTDSSLKIVCGNKDYIVEFDFDEEWDAYGMKTARFHYSGKYEDIVFTGTQCPAPEIRNSLYVKIGVFAGDLHTTTSAYIDCEKSTLCDSGLPADPEPDVYAKLMEQLANISAGVNPFYTTMEKIDGNLLVRLHSGGQDLTGAQLRVKYFVRNRNKHKNHVTRSAYWRHPENYDVAYSNKRWGYANIAGQKIGSGNDQWNGLYYPSVPSWMPNEGYMKTVFAIDSAAAADGSVTIDLTEWMIPLLKPNSYNGEWIGVGLFSLPNIDKGAVHIRFDLHSSDGALLGECKNVLHVGGADRKPIQIDEVIDGGRRINSKTLMRSIT